ncbi:recombination protein F [Bhargavaea cecembensis DSE10]|uniref:Recombination protein F n=1 Tax=Bhargavaea cecembensis DSE10 TaxID=1235279 RepID=M7NDN1_9BACL|nr:AAA family ATPase [Bhargavaea cecembensis]EMR05357.1 recombination protein F [Bhargavaea cecembensis DSE10]
MMTITKLVIYGFGKHRNRTINLQPGINVLYGPNEAGKTTIRQFILHTLFGFPQRGSALLRYEPKSGGAYGGQVHVTDSEYGACVIERIAGRSAGEVTVRFPDGREEGEEALGRLLRGYDRQSFESVFSFSLLQLQEIGRMNEEELGQALIASGTTGAEDLAGFKARMEKEMDGLFKKSGRVPEMNILLNELKEIEEETAEYRKKSDAYAPMKERAAEIARRLKDMAEEEAALAADQERLSVLRQAAPLKIERLQVEDELRTIGDAPFPAEGIRRYEALKDRKIAADATIRNLQERISAVGREMPEEPDTERLSSLRTVLAEEAAWHEARSAESSAEQSIRELAGMRDGLLARLGLEDGETAARADASIRKEEELHGLSEEHGRASRVLERLDERIAEKSADAQRISSERAALEASGPDDEEIGWASKWPSFRKQIAAAEAKQSAGQSDSRLPILILAGLAVIIIAMAIFSENWLLAGAGVAAGAVAVFLLLKQDGSEDGLTDDERQLLSRYCGREEELDRRAERVRRHFTELDRLIEAEERLRGEISELRTSRKTAVADLDDTESRLGRFIESYGITGRLPAQIVPELFRLVRELQETERRIRSEQENRDRAIRTAGLIRSRAHELIGQPVPDGLMFAALKEAEREWLKAAEKRERLLEDQQKMEEQLAEAKSLKEALESEIGTLFDAAEAGGEQEFYEAAGRSARKAELGESLGRIGEQLKQIGAPSTSGIPDIEEISRRIGQNREALQALSEERNRLLKEQAELEAGMGHLVTDTAYDALLQEFEEKKAVFRELALAWAARKAAVTAIDGATGRLKEQKLPDVIERASGWFRDLTGGAHSGLVLAAAGRIEAEGADGMRFGLHELSQATKEQAYISMRLSLAASLLDSAPFPVIMDDPFVHFDRARLGNMINLLEELKIHHQFLYFTCHKEMAGAFSGAAVISVAGTGSGRGVLR